MQEVWIVAGLAIASLAFVATVVFVVNKIEQGRSQRIQAIADEMGLEFSLKGDPLVQDAVSHLRLFNRGRGRSFKNMVAGQTEDVDMAIFGYRFVTGGGKSQRTHLQTVISFRSPQLQLPDFELRPENVFHKIGQALGYQDIDFDTHPQFSKRNVLRGPNETAIRKLFSTHILEDLESQIGISIEAQGDLLIYYRAGKRVRPEQMRSFMADGFRIYKLFKTRSMHTPSL